MRGVRTCEVRPFSGEAQPSLWSTGRCCASPLNECSLNFRAKPESSTAHQGYSLSLNHAPQKSQAEPIVTAILTAADEQTLKQFIDAVQAEIRRATSVSGAAAAEGERDKLNGRKAVDAEAIQYRTYDCHRVGNGHFSVVGRQLFVSNSKAGLEAALDRLAGAVTG